MRTTILALMAAIALPTAAYAAEPAPEKECCCKQMAEGKDCCDKPKQEAGHDVHAGHEPGPRS